MKIQQLTPEQVLDNTELLIKAIMAENSDEVIRLIPLSDPKANNSNALRWAAYRGNIEIARLLIPVSDPQTDYSVAFRTAIMHEHIDMVKLLIPVSGYQNILPILSNYINRYSFLQQCIDEYEMLQQKDRLNNDLADIGDSKNNSVKRKM